MAADNTGVFLFVGLLYLAIIVFVVFLWWRIWAKAGYSGALGILMIVPIANVVAFLIFAFSEWPIQKRVRELEGAPQSFE